MNDVEIMERDLRARFPGATLRMDPPQDPTGTWFIDVRSNQHALTIQWSQDHGFGLSAGAGGYGEGADEVYATITQVEERVGELLGASAIAAR
ncbi:MAG TPA: hypothetical protein VF713_00545 [Thermoanaerobaculia bacterium]